MVFFIMVIGFLPPGKKYDWRRCIGKAIIGKPERRGQSDLRRVTADTDSIYCVTHRERRMPDPQAARDGPRSGRITGLNRRDAPTQPDANRMSTERNDAPAASNFIRNIIDDDNRTGK
ncbi:MAG: hypothetical protein IOB81_35380 [Burkholderia sp.]|nr:hypothetical protein [Burkholderia sp.]